MMFFEFCLGSYEMSLEPTIFHILRTDSTL